MRNPYIKIQDDISNMNTYVRTYVRTSRNQYVPYFFKVGGIKKIGGGGGGPGRVGFVGVRVDVNEELKFL